MSSRRMFTVRLPLFRFTTRTTRSTRIPMRAATRELGNPIRSRSPSRPTRELGIPIRSRRFPPRPTRELGSPIRSRRFASRPTRELGFPISRHVVCPSRSSPKFWILLRLLGMQAILQLPGTIVTTARWIFRMGLFIIGVVASAFHVITSSIT